MSDRNGNGSIHHFDDIVIDAYLPDPETVQAESVRTDVKSQAEIVANSARHEVWELERAIKQARALAKMADGLVKLMGSLPGEITRQTTVAELLAMGSLRK